MRCCAAIESGAVVTMSDTRKLATILSLDVAGFSRAAEQNEAAAAESVRRVRALVTEIAETFGGRIFNTAGDGFMMEFAAASHGVDAAMALLERARDPANDLPAIRIGVHMGEVIVEPNGDLLGHGVNVAARLQALADPGSAIVSETAKAQMRSGAPLPFTPQGRVQLDKMHERINVYALAPGQAAPKLGKIGRRRALRFGAIGAALGLLLIIGVALLRTFGAADAVASNEPAALAVLPFEDLSAEQDQRYFSDGLSEEILNVLKGVEGLRVASRTSAFAYRDGEKALPQIARELGVRHVLEGSVRRAGNRVRISAQLVDAHTDSRIWSKTYERELSVGNLFAIQEEIAGAIVREIQKELGYTLGPQNARRRSVAAGTQSLEAYDLYLRSRDLFNARSDRARAVIIARAATRADPAFAQAWELLAASLFVRDGRPTEEATAAVETALRLDPELSLAHAVKGVMGNFSPPYDWAGTIQSLERAVDLDPTNTTALLWLAIEMHKVGDLSRAQYLLERCLSYDSAYDRCRLHLSWTLHARGYTDRALIEYRRLMSAGAPPDDAVLLPALIERGDVAAVETMIEAVEDGPPMPDLVRRAMMGEPVDRAAAQRALRQWVAQSDFHENDIYAIALELGAYDLVRAQQGSFFPLWLPEFPEYRRSPEFKAFVRTMGLEAYWREHGFPPQCQPVGADDFTCA